MDNVRIAFFGTPEISGRVLEALYDKFSVSLIVTKVDKVRGRGKELTPTFVKQFGIKKGIPVVTTEKIKPSFVEVLKEYRIDLSVVVAYGQILPLEVINYPKYGSLNLHGSLLPELRGASPIQSAIIFGLKKTGITLQKIKYEMDAGDILAQREINIVHGWGADDLLNVIIKEAPFFLAKNLDLYLKNQLKFIPQDKSRVTYCYHLKKNDGLINWEQGAEEIVKRILAFNIWPVCFTYLKSNILRLFKATVYSNLKSREIETLKPGTIYDIKKSVGILVKAGKGVVAIRELQLQNKNRMAFRDFINGYQNLKGSILKNKIS